MQVDVLPNFYVIIDIQGQLLMSDKMQTGQKQLVIVKF